MHPTAVRRRIYAWPSMITAAAFYAAALSLETTQGDDGFRVGLALASFALFFWTIGWDSTYRYTTTHVSTTHFLLTSTVAWQDVSAVETDGGLYLALRDGQSLSSIAYGGSLLGTFTGYRTHQAPGTVLSDAHRAATRTSGRRASDPVRIHRTLAWRRGLLATALTYTPVLTVAALT
ncbi:hypothetical protein ACFVIY_18470 [Streptomyces sp. NPDC127166]|uniref:hypothetical protein n=1 Tax=Streptomyces sp. NPDC127166 TaxID=3345380 RepID=UPI003633A7A9